MFALAVLQGCTRKTESALLSVSIPRYDSRSSKNEVGALAITTKPTRVMINITGPGIAVPIVYIWEMNRDSNSVGQEPPATVELSVPKGSDRLIQVLAILQEINSAGSDGDSPMTFYYGDTVRAISQSSEAVDITLANQGTSGNTQGSVSGRYFDGSGTPTDLVDMLYNPGAGRPLMIVETGFIFGGWFHIFALKGVPFTYRLRNRGIALFENLMPDSLATSTRVGRATIPAAYRNIYSGGTVTGRSASPERIAVFGLFGPAAPASGKACFDSTIEQMSSLYVSSTVGDPTTVQYDPSSGLASEVQIVGGVSHPADDQCPGGSGSFGVDHMTIRKQNLNYGDSPVGNRGPFRGIVSGQGQSFLTAALVGSDLQLAWDYLPGVIGSGVDGVGVFSKVFASSSEVSDRWHERAPCNQLVGMGYTEHTRVAAGSPGSPVEAYTINGVNATAWNESRLHVVACPYSASRSDYYDFAIAAKNNGGGGGPAATQILAKHVGVLTTTSAGDPQTIASDVCTPIKLMMADASGNAAYRNGTNSPQLTAAVVTAPNDVKLYSDPNCSMPAGGTSTLVADMHNPETLIFVKATSPATAFSINVIDSSSGGTALAMHTYYGSRVSNLGPTDLRIFAKPNIMAHSCFPVVIMQGRDDAGKFVVDSTSPVSGPTYPVVTDLQFFYDGQCESSAGSIFLSSQQGALLAYAKYTGALPSITMPIGGTSGLVHGSATVNVSQPGTATRLRLSMSGNFGAEACMSVRLTSVDSSGNLSPVPSAASISYLYNAAAPIADSGFYSDPTCTSATGGPGLGALATQSSSLYFRWAASGALAVTGTVTGPAIAFEDFNTSVGPTVLGRIVVRPQGVSYAHSVAGTFTGYAPFTLENEWFNLTLEARSPLGTLLSGFSNADLSPTGINLRTDYEADVTLTCNPISWSGGIANTSCALDDIGANNFSSKLFPFRTGGGISPLPFYESGTSSVGHIRISKPADSPDVMTFMVAHDMSYEAAACLPFLVVRGYNNSGHFQATRALGPYAATMSSGAGISGWYSDPACTVSTSGFATIPTGASGAIVYGSFSGTAPSAVAADGNWSMNYNSVSLTAFSGVSVGVHNSFRLSMSREIAAGSCSPLMVVRTDANGQAVAAVGMENITLSAASITGTFHSAGVCDVGSDIGTTLTFNAGDKAKLIYFKTSNMAAGATITATNGGNSGSVSPINVNY